MSLFKSFPGSLPAAGGAPQGPFLGVSLEWPAAGVCAPACVDQPDVSVSRPSCPSVLCRHTRLTPAVQSSNISLHAPDKAVTPLVPPGLGHPATHVSVASLHIDVHPRLPGVMAEHPRSQKQELQPLRAQQQRSLHSLWMEPATCQLRFKGGEETPPVPGRGLPGWRWWYRTCLPMQET